MISSSVITSSRSSCCCSIILLLSTIYHQIPTTVVAATTTTTKSTITTRSSTTATAFRIFSFNNHNNKKYIQQQQYNQHSKHFKHINQQQHLIHFSTTSTTSKSSLSSSTLLLLFSFPSINTLSRVHRHHHNNILSRGVFYKCYSIISTRTTSTSSSTIYQRLPVRPFGSNYDKYNNNAYHENNKFRNSGCFRFNSISTGSSGTTDVMMKEIPSISTCSTDNDNCNASHNNSHSSPNERKWIVCTNCNGEGRIERSLSRKARYKKRKQSTTTTKTSNECNVVVQDDNNNINNTINKMQQQVEDEQETQQQQQPKTYKSCIHCNGSGLVPYTRSSSDTNNDTDTRTTNTEIQTNAKSSTVTSRNINDAHNTNTNNNNFHISIIGGGIGGLALCASLQHRNINCTLYERDISFNVRQHGYGLTLQQISKQLHSLGIVNMNHNDIDNDHLFTTSTTSTTTPATKLPVLLPGGITSTKHIVHKIDGTIVGQWGMRHWQGLQQQEQQQGQNESSDGVDATNSTRQDCNKLKNNKYNHSNKEYETDGNSNKRQNIHIARQALRYLLYQAAIAGTTTSSNNKSTSTSSQNDNTIIENQQIDVIKWNHKLIGYQQVDTSLNTNNNNNNNYNNKIELQFDTGTNTIQKYYTDLIVGADGIRSYVRNQLFDNVLPNNQNSLRYLQCFVILGICSTSTIVHRLRTKIQQQQQQQNNTTTDNTSTNTIDYALSLLDGKTVFQTADGTTRIYVMPYSDTEYMWQLSFPMESESDAIAMSTSSSATSAATTTTQSTTNSQQKVKVLQEAINRCQTWHKPILDIIQSTSYESCTGYPVYDRPVLTINDFNLLKESSFNDKKVISSLSTKTTFSTVTNNNINIEEKEDEKQQQQQQLQQTYRKVTILGDAAHPMSPFKGQGANQAMIDALQLSRSIYKHLIVIPERDAKKKENRKKESNSNDSITTTTSTSQSSIINPNNSNNNNNSSNNDDKYDDDNNRIAISQRIEQAIIEYEKEMIPRTTIKVHASEAAAQFLHSDIAIQEGNITRGAAAAAAVAVAASKTTVASSLSEYQR